MRKSRYRRRGLALEVKKQKMRSKLLDDQKGLIGTILNSRSVRQRLTDISVKSCALINETAIKFCLVPVFRDEFGNFHAAPWSQLIVHFSFLLMWFALTALKLHGCILLISQGILDVRTFICLALLGILSTSTAVALACLLKPKETAQLLNCSESILECVGVDVGKRIVPCDSPEVSLKVIGLNFLIWLTAVDAAAFTLLDDSLPVSLYPNARRLGILEGDGEVVLGWIWKILFLPFEFISYALPILSAVFAAQVLVTTIGTFSACMNEVRYENNK